MTETNDNIADQRRQAYVDSKTSFQQIVNKHRIRTDPILQQNEYYVSIILLFYIITKFFSQYPNIKSI